MLEGDHMEPGVFTIFLGDDKAMLLKAVTGGCAGGDPLDLTSCSEIDVILPKADGTFAHRLLSAGQVVITSPALLGKFTAQIPSAVSALLQVGELQSFDVAFTISAQKTTVRFANALSVFQP